MMIQEMLKKAVNQVDESIAFPIFQRTEESVDEIVLASDVDGIRYYLVRSRPQDDQSVNLSPREQSIARLVAQGLPNKCIGKELGISPWTVATHLRRVFKKLDVNSRAAMTARLIEANLLQD
ncbi:MAG: response regulator transcription factor [Limnoraphis robusta]|jgi:DNA-binding CsgD family transcriptional regulator